MKRRRLFELVAGCGLVLIGLYCQGQDSFRYRAPVDSVSATGFYTIELSPGLLAKSNAPLSDLRLRDAQGRFVSYVLDESTPGAGEAGYQLLPDPVFRQKDSSDHHSYLELEWPEAYRVERLSLKISEPALYKRLVRIYTRDAGGDLSQVATVSIDPHDTVFSIPFVKSNRLRLDIVNADNVPLKINKVTSWQAAVHLMSYLQGASAYEILTGNGSATTPQYDLNFFTDRMKREAKALGIGAVQEAKPAIVAVPPVTVHSGGQGRMHDTVLLWGSLLIVLVILIYFSIRMVKAIGKKDDHDRV